MFKGGTCVITSLQNETIKEFMKLKQKKYRDEKKQFLIEGYHLVEEALKYGCVDCVITVNEEKYEVETYYVSSRVMEKLAFTKSPQPIMAVCHYNQENHILQGGKRYLLLERVQDPGNVGTLLRTALAFGYDQVIMSKDCVDLYNDKVIRSTQGALFQLNVCVTDVIMAIHTLKDMGVEVYGTCLHNAREIDEYVSQEQMAFVLGNEGQGMSQEAILACQHLLYIPIQSIDSLNVGVAGAITMYQFKN